MMEYYQKIYKVTMEIRLMEMLLEEKNDMKSDIGDIVWWNIIRRDQATMEMSLMDILGSREAMGIFLYGGGGLNPIAFWGVFPLTTKQKKTVLS